MKSQPTWQELFSQNEDVEPQKIYYIAFTPRSGSTWFGSILEKTRLLGIPKEWFNQHAANHTIRLSGARDFNEYFQFLKHHRKRNRVFAAEIAYFHFQKLLNEGYDFCFSHIDAWFFLRRQDYIAQAVSLYRANQTGVFHIRGETPPKIELPYNCEEIQRQVLSIMNQEYRFHEYFKQTEIKPTLLWYEDIAAALPETIQQIASTINVQIDPESDIIQEASDTDFKITRDDNSNDIINQFKKDNEALIDFWDNNRGKTSVWQFNQQR